MRKKGQEGYSTVTTFAAVIMIGLVLAVLTVGIVKWVKSRSLEQRCSLSSWMQDTGDDYFIGVNLDCPAPHEDIKTKNEIETMHKIAMHLKACWQKTGRGKRALLGTSNVEGDVKCVVCSTFTLDRDIRVDDMVNYLETQPMPPQNDITYSEFLDTDYKRGTSKVGDKVLSEEEEALIADTSIFQVKGNTLKKENPVTGKPIEYLVLVWRDEHSKLWQLFWDADTAEVNIDGKTVETDIDNAEKGVQTIFVVPKSNYQDLKCEYIYWKKPENEEELA
ncbi:hypothetical protein D6764_05840 [Candidatus Woesearchaeota archaeon]|nr:MAG: hypothetical protein D6764_05840 [Candidatus Woesearchaeota archaeon]